MRYHSPNDQNLIQELNDKLGMHHRSEPYDLNNVEDVKEALMKLVAEFTDYASYSNVLDNVLENLDESIEYYDPSAYINIASGHSLGTDDKMASSAYYSLRNSLSKMEELENRAKSWCEELLSLVLSRSDDFQTQVFGKAYIFDAKRINELFFDAACDINEYTFQDSYKAFITLMDQTLESK